MTKTDESGAEKEIDLLIHRTSCPKHGKKNLCCNNPINLIERESNADLMMRNSPFMPKGVGGMKTNEVECKVCGYRQILCIDKNF